MERGFGLGRFNGVEAEDLDPAACRLLKLQPGPDHTGIVEYKVTIAGQVNRQIQKNILGNGSSFDNQQFRPVPHLPGELCDPSGRQGIVVV